MSCDGIYKYYNYIIITNRESRLPYQPYFSNPVSILVSILSIYILCYNVHTLYQVEYRLAYKLIYVSVYYVSLYAHKQALT